jgi:hypothetical protein
MSVTADDIGTYLGIDVTAVSTRLDYIISLAEGLAETVVTPLPDGSDAVIVDIVTRAYSNPSNADSQGAGPYNVNWGAVAGGLWLTKQNKATLRNLAGRGGAFTFDTMPATAGQGLPAWDIDGAAPCGDWDTTP